MAKKVNKNVSVKKELGESEMQELAHLGTKEAVEKIEKYIKNENDLEKKSYAQMALEECEFNYYEAKNEKEEEEFMLCALIRENEMKVESLKDKVENIKMRMDKLSLEKKVHEKVLAKHKNKEEAWRYNWMEDFVISEENQLHEIEDQIAYEKAWIEEAKKMITVARYKTMPARYLESFDFNFGSDFLGDKDCCDDDCDENCEECADESFCPPF